MASRRFPAVFWTHNDSGHRAVLYAITREGALIGKWKVVGRKLTDWEEITADDDGNLYLADTGNNHLDRETVFVHRIKEPDPTHRGSQVVIEHSWQLQYPAGQRNCESLIVFQGQGYLATKRTNGPAEIYRFSLSPTSSAVTLELVGETAIQSPVTAIAISAHGKVVALISPEGAFACRIDGDFTRLCGSSMVHTPFRNRNIEGCTFVSDGLLSVAEKGRLYLFTNSIFRSE